MAVNWSLGSPTPEVGETIWMVCPYRTELCGADATLTVETITDIEVTGLLVCSNGHRWSLARLAGKEGPDGTQ